MQYYEHKEGLIAWLRPRRAVLPASITATDTVYENLHFTGGENKLTLSSNQTWMSAGEYSTDTNLNVESGLALNGREGWNQTAVYGEKMSADGNQPFLPLSSAIDVFDGRIGFLLKSIALPVTHSANYDALVSDGKDNVLVAITGQKGDGVAVIDLTSLPESPPLPYASVSTNNLARMSHVDFTKVMKRPPDRSAKAGTWHPGRHPQRIPHRTNPFITGRCAGGKCGMMTYCPSAQEVGHEGLVRDN